MAALSYRIYEVADFTFKLLFAVVYLGDFTRQRRQVRTKCLPKLLDSECYDFGGKEVVF